MRNVLASMAVVLWPSIDLAQPTYEKVYLGGGFGHLIELSSHNILTGYGYSASDNVTGVSLLDQQGNILHSNCRMIDTMLVLIGLRKYSDNEFFFTSAYYKDTCAVSGQSVTPRMYPVIGSMDSLGHILSSHYYEVNSAACTNMVGDLMVLGNKSVITWGKSLAMKVDSSGEPIWSEYFNNNAFLRFIKELPGGDLLAGFYMDTAGASIARLDANGNFLWCKSYMRPSGRVHDAVIVSDSSFVITGYTGSMPNKLFMMKLDGSGSVQWCRGYDSAPTPWYETAVSRIVSTEAGYYTVLAPLGQLQIPYFYRPFLMKTDQNGDTLWTRSMGANGYVYEALNLLAYSDGGYLISCNVWGALPNGWSSARHILKADSGGHFSCTERYAPVEILDLFPTDSSFTLTFVDGAIAMPAFAEETSCDPILVFDGCTFTTNLPERGTPAKRMTLRPNPNTGRFTLEFKDPLLAESWYSVYDATGKLLFQRPLPPGKGTEEVDLSRYGKGTYMIKCTDRDGVYHERVVVE